MKKALFTGSLIAATFLSYGQRKGLWIAPTLSIGAASYWNAYNGDMSGANYGLGLDATYMFSSKIGITTGASYQHFSIFDYRYALQIPLYLRFVSGRNGAGFFIQTGASFGAMSTEPRYNGRNIYYTESGYVSAHLNFGWYIRSGNKTHMTLGPLLDLHSTGAAVAALKFTVGIKAFTPNQ